VSLGVAVSHLVNPMKTSLTSGEGEVRIPTCRNRPLAGGEPSADLWGVGDRVPKRGSIVRVCSGTVGSAGRRNSHSSSLAVANMASTAPGGSGRLL